VTAQKF